MLRATKKIRVGQSLLRGGCLYRKEDERRRHVYVTFTSDTIGKNNRSAVCGIEVGERKNWDAIGDSAPAEAGGGIDTGVVTRRDGGRRVGVGERPMAWRSFAQAHEWGGR